MLMFVFLKKMFYIFKNKKYLIMKHNTTQHTQYATHAKRILLFWMMQVIGVHVLAKNNFTISNPAIVNNISYANVDVLSKDMNGDGKDDIILFDHTDGSIKALINNSSIALNTTIQNNTVLANTPINLLNSNTQFNSANCKLVLANVVGSNEPDAIIYNSSNHTIYVLENNGGFTTNTSWLTLSANTNYEILVGNFTNSIYQDLVIFNKTTGDISIATSNGTSAFTLNTTSLNIGSNSSNTKMFVGRFDSPTGVDDLLFYDNIVGTLITMNGNYVGTTTSFSAGITYTSPTNTLSLYDKETFIDPSLINCPLQVGDFDGDGLYDILAYMNRQVTNPTNNNNLSVGTILDPTNITRPQVWVGFNRGNAIKFNLWFEGGSFDVSDSYKIIVTDFYKDGRADFFVQSQNASALTLCINSPHVEGYCWPLSAKNDGTESINFYLSGHGLNNTIAIYKYTSNDDNVNEIPTGNSITGAVLRPQYVSSLAWQDGCNWSQYGSFVIPIGMESGFYAAKLLSIDGTIDFVTFVVKSATPTCSKILLLANTNTWQAYNGWCGSQDDGVYGSNNWPVPNNTRRAKYSPHWPAFDPNPTWTTAHNYSHFSMMRPNPNARPDIIQGTDLSEKDIQLMNLRAELWIYTWLKNNGYESNVITDMDLDAMPIAELNQYKTLIISTHPEYWTDNEYDKTLQFKKNGAGLNGGNIIHLGGNSIFEVNKYSTSTITGEPQIAFYNGADYSVRNNFFFENISSYNPPKSASKIIGVHTEGDASCTPVPYYVNSSFYNYFLFNGISLNSSNSIIGLQGYNNSNSCCGAVGWEADELNTNDELPNTVLLADDGATKSDMIYSPSENTLSPNGNHGFTFAAPSIHFGGSLAYSGISTNNQPELSRMMKNILSIDLVSIHIDQPISCAGFSDGALSIDLCSNLGLIATWSNGQTGLSISGLSAGIYSVTVSDANGISTTATVSLTTSSSYCCNQDFSNSLNKEMLDNVSNLNFPTNISNKSFFINGAFTINQNIVFDHCTFYFTADAKILVTNGSVFQCSYCTFKAGCNTMWDGIYADDPSEQIVLENCFLKDATTGVSLLNNAKCNLSNNTFTNNYNNVVINLNSIAGTCSFTNNTFNFAGLLLAPNATEKTTSGFLIQNSTNVAIGGISGNFFDNLSCGIHVEEFTYLTGQFPNQQIQIPPNSVVQLTNNKFTNIKPDANYTNIGDEIGTAIYAHREDPWFSLRVNVYNTLATTNPPITHFNNCEKAIWVRNTTTTIDKQKINNSAIAILATECEGKRIRVTSNTITDSYWGILKSGDESTNGFIAISNIITLPNGNEDGWISFPPIGIYSAYSSKVHVGRSNISDNSIQMPLGNTGLGITLAEGSSDYIYYNQVHFSTPNISQNVSLPKMIGIYANNGDAVNITNNTIDNGGGSQYVKTNNTGIYLLDTKNSLLQCNTMNYTKYGIFAVGQNGSTTQYDRTAGNYMNNSDANLMLWKLAQEGTMGQVGINSLTTKFDANNIFNEPHDINPAMTQALYNKVYKVTDCPQLPQLIENEIVTTFNKLDQSRSSTVIGNLLDCKVTITNPTTGFTSTFTCSTVSNSSTTSTSHPMDLHYALLVANNEIDYSEYLEGARRADEELVQQWLENNENERTSSAILNTFYLERNADIVGQLNAIDRQISLLNDSTLRSSPEQWMTTYNLARTMNHDLQGSLVFEQNAKYMNDLYLNTLLRGRDTLNEEQQQDIETLAFICPYIGGNAVFRARVLYSMRHWGIHYDDLVICNGQGVYKNGTSKLQEQLNQLSNSTKAKILKDDEVIIYPNPATKFITIACKNANEIVIQDLLGAKKLVSKLDINLVENKLNISSLPFGIYFYKIFRKDNSVYTGKLLIE